MKRLWAIIAVLLLTLPTQVAYSNLHGDFNQEESDESNFEDFEKPEQFEIEESSHSFSGPGGCSSPDECMSYCQDNPDECNSFAKSSHARFDGVDHFRDIDRAEMAVGMMFQDSSIEPRNFVQYCPDAEAMVDAVIDKMKSEGNFEVQCSQFEEEVSECREHADVGCEQIKNEDVIFEYEDGIEVTCSSLNKDELYNNCLTRNEQFASEFGSPEERCEEEWTRTSAGSASFCEFSSDQICDRDEFIRQEKDNQREICESTISEDSEDRENQIDECVNELDYEEIWDSQKQSCQNTNEICDKDAYIASCVEREREFQNEINEQDKELCEEESERLYEDLSDICEEQEEFYNECKEDAEEMCSYMEESLSECRNLNEDDIRDNMLEHASRFCKFYSSQSEGERGQFIAMMNQAKGELPQEYKVLMDKKAEDVINAEETEERETNKGLGYKLKWAIGAAAEEEKKSADELDKSVQDIRDAIDALKLAKEQIQDEATKSLIQEQIDKLKEKANKLEETAEKKRKRSGGLVSILTGNIIRGNLFS